MNRLALILFVSGVLAGCGGKGSSLHPCDTNTMNYEPYACGEWEVSQGIQRASGQECDKPAIVPECGYTPINYPNELAQ